MVGTAFSKLTRVVCGKVSANNWMPLDAWFRFTLVCLTYFFYMLFLAVLCLEVLTNQLFHFQFLLLFWNMKYCSKIPECEIMSFCRDYSRHPNHQKKSVWKYCDWWLMTADLSQFLFVLDLQRHHGVGVGHHLNKCKVRNKINLGNIK